MVKKSLQVKNASSILAENLEVSVTLTTPDGTKLDHAARVLVVDSTGKYALFDNTGTLITTAPATSSAISFGDLTAGQVLDMNVYIYYDGTDTLAKNVTAIATDPISVAFLFSIKGSQYNSATIVTP